MTVPVDPKAQQCKGLDAATQTASKCNFMNIWYYYKFV